MYDKNITCPTIHAVQASDKVMLSARLADNDRSCTLEWLPDTGSDVDAIGASHLRRLGGSVADLEPDPDHVVAVNGQPLTSLGTVPARVVARDVTHTTVRLHVYDELSSALLSRSSLKALCFLPPNWPQIASVTQGTSRSTRAQQPYTRPACTYPPGPPRSSSLTYLQRTRSDPWTVSRCTSNSRLTPSRSS